VIGVLGGSGIYQVDGLDNARWKRVASPFGEPSDELLFGEIDGHAVVFLPRHGRGHRIPPSEVNYRANIDALKRSGVTQVLALSAVGSLREELAPGTFVLVDQFIDRTFAREKSFFGAGLVAHVSVAHPVCKQIGDQLEAAALAESAKVARGGTYVVMEGPQFSTLAESNLYRKWGCDVVGMTNMPEAKLAREAELCYATLAMVTDYDCWHPDHDHVSVASVVAVLNKNSELARRIIRRVVPMLGDRPRPCPQGCDRALETAIMTHESVRDPAMVDKLGSIVARVLRKKSP